MWLYVLIIKVNGHLRKQNDFLVQRCAMLYGNSLSYTSIKLECYRYQIKYLGPESIIKDNNLAELNAGNCPPHMSVSSNNQCTTSTTKIFNHQNH